MPTFATQIKLIQQSPLIYDYSVEKEKQSSDRFNLTKQ